MQPSPIPVRDAFTDLARPFTLACGITAHLVDPSNIDPARASRFNRHDRITGAGHTGWYADILQFETLTGVVYALAPDTGDGDSHGTTYYALALSNDTDCHYLDPDAYNDAIEAAHAADCMAERVADLDLECDRLRTHACKARRELADANQTRREALDLLRHARSCPVDAESLGAAFARLWRHAAARRRRAFDCIGEHRPPPRRRPFDPSDKLTPAECHADAWREGWDWAGRL